MKNVFFFYLCLFLTSCITGLDSQNRVYSDKVTSIKIEEFGGLPYPLPDGRPYSPHLTKDFLIAELSQKQVESLKRLKITKKISQMCIEDGKSYRLTTFNNDTILNVFIDNNCLTQLKSNQNYIDVAEFIEFAESYFK